MAESSNLIVELGDERFQLDKLPAATSQLVLQRRKLLVGSIRLDEFIVDLGRVGTFIRIAYNGVADCTDLQIKVQRIGYKITRLCDKSAVTVFKFSSVSNQILDDLQACYGYLIDGLEDVALDIIQSLSSIAKDMARAAEELHTEFEKAADDVIDALEATQTRQGVERQRKEQISKQLQDYAIKKKQAEVENEQANAALKKAEDLLKEARAREDKIYSEQSDIGRQLLKTFTGIAMTVVAPGATLDDSGEKETNKELLQSLRQEKLKHLDAMEKKCAQRSEALKSIAEFTLKIQHSVSDSTIADVTIESLHSAIGGLKELSAIMLTAAQFWKQMHEHCLQMADSNLKEMINKYMQKEEKIRKKIWLSNAFKKQAVTEYSKWVALAGVCEEYTEQIKLTQKDLHAYLRDNPTPEQAKKNVRELAAKFADDLAKAQQQLEKEREEYHKQHQEEEKKPIEDAAK